MENQIRRQGTEIFLKEQLSKKPELFNEIIDEIISFCPIIYEETICMRCYKRFVEHELTMNRYDIFWECDSCIHCRYYGRTYSEVDEDSPPYWERDIDDYTDDEEEDDDPPPSKLFSYILYDTDDDPDDESDKEEEDGDDDDESDDDTDDEDL